PPLVTHSLNQPNRHTYREIPPSPIYNTSVIVRTASIQKYRIYIILRKRLHLHTSRVGRHIVIRHYSQEAKSQPDGISTYCLSFSNQNDCYARCYACMRKRTISLTEN
ncbi:unnamed protein product, partial [Ectocarpus sp. 8 AP-2014]